MLVHHAPDNYVCPFCCLVRAEQNEQTLSIVTDIVQRRSQVTAFISSHQWPNNPGNVLVVPNEHFENIYELPPALGAEIQAMTQAIAVAMKEVWHCAGVSTRQHNEPAGGQDVWHYHLHVTPRYHKDGFYASYARARTLVPAEERARYAQELREYLEAKSHA